MFVWLLVIVAVTVLAFLTHSHFSRCIVVKIKMGCASLNHFDLVAKGLMEPSRITDITAMLIDNIFTNELQFQVNSSLLITDISDRFLLFAVINLYAGVQLLHSIEEF